MAVVDVSSQLISDLNASPTVKVDPQINEGIIRVRHGQVEVGVDDANSIYRVMRVASGDFIHSCRVHTDTAIAGSAATFSISLYDINGGDQVELGIGYDTFDPTASLKGVELIPTPIQIGVPLWQLLTPAPAQDPQKLYDLTLFALSPVDSVGGTVAITVLYSPGF